MYYVYTALPQQLSPCLSGARYALQRYKRNRPLAGFFVPMIRCGQRPVGGNHIPDSVGGSYTSYRHNYQ